MRLFALAFLASMCLLAANSAFAQMPGAFQGPPCFAQLDLREGPNEPGNEQLPPVPLPCPVFAGYVVLLESGDAALQQDPTNWSGVVAFTTAGPVQPGSLTDHVYFISDSSPAGAVENGITAADLAFAGLTVADIVGNPTTVYLVEGQNTLSGFPDANIYDALGPGPAAAHYILHSDPPTEGPVATDPVTWGRVKGQYR